MGEQIKEIIDLELSGLELLKEQLNEDIITVVKILNETEGNILVTGMGTSGTIARRMVHLFRCSGRSSFFVHPADQQHGASGGLKEGDTIIVFSRGGETTEINNFLKIAVDKGCKIIAITGHNDSTMSQFVDISILIHTPEKTEPFGLIATTSSLASALVGDVICTLLLKVSDYSKEDFGRTHPGGLVGEKFEKGV